jgi:hypothetical protein
MYCPNTGKNETGCEQANSDPEEGERKLRDITRVEGRIGGEERNAGQECFLAGSLSWRQSLAGLAPQPKRVGRGGGQPETFNIPTRGHPGWSRDHGTTAGVRP